MDFALYKWLLFSWAIQDEVPNNMKMSAAPVLTRTWNVFKI